MDNFVNTDNLSKTKSKNKQILMYALDKMIKENEEITVKNLAAKTGFSVGIIYQYSDIKNKIKNQKFLNSKRNKKINERRKTFKKKKVYEAICKLESMKLGINFENVSKYSGVSTNFLYSEDDLRSNIEYLMSRKNKSKKELESINNIRLYNEAIDKMLAENKIVNFKTVSKYLNINIKELYKYDDIRERIIKIRIENINSHSPFHRVTKKSEDYFS